MNNHLLILQIINYILSNKRKFQQFNKIKYEQYTFITISFIDFILCNKL